MKMVVALFALLSAALFCCKDRFKSWKDSQNSDYIKDSLIYDSENFYLYRHADSVILTFEIGEYDPYNIEKRVPGVMQMTGHKIWIDSNFYDLECIKKYFAEFTHRGIK